MVLGGRVGGLFSLSRLWLFFCCLLILDWMLIELALLSASSTSLLGEMRGKSSFIIDELREKDNSGTYSTPKLCVVAFGDHRSFTIWPQSGPDEIECRDQSLAVSRVESVFGSFAHRDDEDVAIVAVEGQVWFVDYGGGHSCLLCSFLIWSGRVNESTGG